jgi:hypothetical protein
MVVLAHQPLWMKGELLVHWLKTMWIALEQVLRRIKSIWWAVKFSVPWRRRSHVLGGRESLEGVFKRAPGKWFFWLGQTLLQCFPGYQDDDKNQRVCLKTNKQKNQKQILSVCVPIQLQLQWISFENAHYKQAYQRTLKTPPHLLLLSLFYRFPLQTINIQFIFNWQ